VNLKVEDVDSLPYSLWGKVRRRVRDWSLSARVDSGSTMFVRSSRSRFGRADNNLSSWLFDLQASSGISGTAVQVKGAVDIENTSTVISSIKVAQKREIMGGEVTVVPRYNVVARKADISVAYGIDDTVVAVDASSDKQRVTVSQRIGINNAITPSVTSEGEVEIEYRRQLPSGSVAATLRPDEFLEIQWEDGPWQASIKAPIEGLYRFSDEGVKVNFKRKIDFL